MCWPSTRLPFKLMVGQAVGKTGRRLGDDDETIIIGRGSFDGNKCDCFHQMRLQCEHILMIINHHKSERRGRASPWTERA